jgi:hypothetical protein
MMRGPALIPSDVLKGVISVGFAVAVLLFLVVTVSSGPTCSAWPAGQEVEPTPPPDDEAGGGGDDEAGGAGDVEAGAEPAGDVEVAAEADDSELLANTLKWSTASEVDLLGFDIYRSVDEDDEFERINEDAVPGAGTTDEPQYYLYIDESIEPGQGYYYYIESITVDGVRKQFSPITFVAAKVRDSRDQEEEEQQ